MEEKTKFTVETTVRAPVEKVWELWNSPEHIVKWDWAAPEWHTPMAENDLRAGGKFNYRMEAKDGSDGFDFWGIYDEIRFHQLIAYTIGDGRKVKVIFDSLGNETIISQTFETEGTHSAETQRKGWQAILDHFKMYAESRP